MTTKSRQTQSVRHRRAGRFFLFLALLLTLPACHRQQVGITRLQGTAQGTYYSILYSDPQHRDLRQYVEALFADFDREASLWVDNSLVRRINAGLTDTLSPMMADMLAKSIYINQYTEGAFDCRIGKLVQAWGFSFRNREEPNADVLAAMLRDAHGVISIEGNRIIKQYPGTELDFNAIAQGYCVDLLAAMMDSLSIDSYLIDVGGEVIARGSKPDGSAWRVGIEKPAADSLSAPQVQTAISLRNASVVTSGSYRKYYERDGVKYSHTIDPATGRPVQHSLLSVSVVDSTAWLADAMATAYMVMGLDSALSFIAHHPGAPGTGAVMFIFDDHGSLRSYATSQFDKLKVDNR